jgi:LysM repeat protein
LIIPDDAPAYGEFPAVEDSAGAGGGAAGELYVVQPRETIDGISARFNVSYTCVLDTNQILNPRALQPGTVIVIPDDCPAYSGADVVGTG